MGDLGLRLLPLLHVNSLAPNVAFLEAMGGQLVYGSRDGDWALMDLAGSEVSLLAHSPNAAVGDERCEFNFVSREPLETVEAHLREQSVTIIQGTSDEMFGRQLKVQTPDGLLVKIYELDRSLIT